MKRYWLFGGDPYYATGGFNDFIDSYQYLDQAVDIGQSEDGPSWWHVFDSQTQTVIAISECIPYGAEDSEGFTNLSITPPIQYPK